MVTPHGASLLSRRRSNHEGHPDMVGSLLPRWVSIGEEGVPDVGGGDIVLACSLDMPAHSHPAIGGGVAHPALRTEDP